VIPPRVTPHQPWPPAPPETGRATSWYRPVTATWASPARHAPPRDASGHRSQRVCEPTEVAPGGRLATWAAAPRGEWGGGIQSLPGVAVRLISMSTRWSAVLPHGHFWRRYC
jgi:hypothetical protein